MSRSRRRCLACSPSGPSACAWRPSGFGAGSVGAPPERRTPDAGAARDDAAGAPSRRSRPADRRPASLGGGPVQLPLPVLHAGRRPSLARPLGDPDLRGEPAAGRAPRLDGRLRSETYGGRAAGPPGVSEAGRDASRRRGSPGDLGHHERLPARARRGGAGPGGRRPVQRVGGLVGARRLLQDHPPRRSGPGDARPGGRRHVPGGEADQGQRGRDARLHRERGPPLLRAGPLDGLPGAVHRVHAAGRRRGVGVRTPC